MKVSVLRDKEFSITITMEGETPAELASSVEKEVDALLEDCCSWPANGAGRQFIKLNVYQAPLGAIDEIWRHILGKQEKPVVEILRSRGSGSQSTLHLTIFLTETPKETGDESKIISSKQPEISCG